MIDIHSLSLKDITPPNIAQDENISALISAIDPQLQQLSYASLEPLIMARIDELPENVLDLLAWQLHADFYDLAGTLSMKREAVKSSILWHMHKGTEWAILEALRQIDISAEFVPWWETGDDPYTFRLKAIVSGDFYRTQGRDKLQASIRRAVEESKAARSYLAGLETEIHFTDEVNLFAGVIPVISGEHTMRLALPERPSATQIFVALAAAQSGFERVLLSHEQNIDTQIFVAPITLEHRDIELGVNLSDMQELLQRFEARILSRIDQYERNTTNLINAKQLEINLQLEEIKSMLRWKAADEEV